MQINNLGCFPLCIQENVSRMLPNVLRGQSEKDRRRISPIISAFDRMKNDSRYVISISKEKYKENCTYSSK